MTNEEWNEMQKRWLASNKFAQFKQKREEQKMRNELRMNKQELLQVIDSLMSYHHQSVKDKEVSDWLLFDKDKQSVINDHLKQCIKWSFYLKQYEIVEDYDMCILLRDLIQLETEDVKRFCSNYYVYSDFDEQTINNNPVEAREFIEKEYNCAVAD